MTDLVLSPRIKPGDSILVGQGTGEPRTLTEALVDQRAQFDEAVVFLGASYSNTFQPEHADHLNFVALGGLGTNARLAAAGALDVLPCHVSALPGYIESSRFRVDVVLVQVSPAGPDGRYSLGLVADYLQPAIARARTVIAEVNDQMPRTLGDCAIDPEALDYVIHTSRPLVSVEPPVLGPVEGRIGQLVAELIPERPVIQLGLGKLGYAVAQALEGRRDLAFHGGVVGDWLVALTEAGAVSNRYKPIDRGATVTGTVVGTRRLYDFVHENPAVKMRPISYTHAPATLRRLERFIAVNTALEVDLTGQTNAETLGGRHIGAIGGQVDFARAAAASRGGLSVVALGASAGGGDVSRIVPRLADGVVTTPRSDAGVVVTEHGVADLRGAPLGERAQRLIAIADPSHRAALSRYVADHVLC